MVEHVAEFDHELLAAPGAETARRYLDHAAAILERRQRIVDGRASAWGTILQAVFVAGFIAIFSAAMKQGTALTAFQTLMVPLLLMGQILDGIIARGEQPSRAKPKRRLVRVGSMVILPVMLFLLLWLVLDESALPGAWSMLPAALVFLSFGGYGVGKLVRASSGPPPFSPPRAALTPGIGWATVAVGIVLGIATAIGAVRDENIRSAILSGLLLMLVVWFSAPASAVALRLIGASWRWPHICVCAASVGLVFVLQIPTPDGASFAPPVYLVSGAAIAVSLWAASRVEGRDLDA